MTVNMSTVVRYSLWYVAGIVVVLLALAVYFFFMMGKSLTVGREDIKTLQAENASLDMQSKALTLTISQLESQFSEQAKTLEQAQALIARLRHNREKLDWHAECQAMSSTEAYTLLQSQLDDTQIKQSRCTAKLAESRAQITVLEVAAQKADNSEFELQLANSTIRDLQAELESARQVNQQYRSDEVGRLLGDQAQQLETKLAQANQQILSLQLRLNQVLAENQEMIATSRPSGGLQLTEFRAIPKFCNTQFPKNGICLDSIEIMAAFNFSPSGFISMKVIDPAGHTIKRESVAGRKINHVSIDIGNNEPALTGDYVVEFSVNDVFNSFNQSQGFSIVN